MGIRLGGGVDWATNRQGGEMRILVTGATGFVGSALCASLTADGYDVVAVSRNPQAAAERLKGIKAVGWDDLGVALSMPTDAVVHLAGESVQGRWNQRKIEAVWDSRVQTTKQVVDAIAAAESKPGVLVCASGIGFYGSAGEDALTETTGAGDDYFAKLCVEWEALARSAPCRTAMLRFGIVIGRGGGALPTMLIPARLGVSGPLGGGQQWWSWIDVTDAVGAIRFTIDSDIEGPINVVAPEPIRQADFNRVLCGVVHRPSFMPAPAFALRAILGTFASEILSSKRVIPERLQASGFQWAMADLEESIRTAVA